MFDSLPSNACVAWLFTLSAVMALLRGGLPGRGAPPGVEALILQAGESVGGGFHMHIAQQLTQVDFKQFCLGEGQ